MGCFSKYGLITINFFLVCIGLSVVGTSAAILHKNTIFGAVLTNVFFSVPLTTLLAGIFLTCLGFLGCLGAIKEHSCMLKLYAVVVGVLLVAVLATGIALVVFSANTSDFIVRSMTKVFDEYGEEDQETLTDNLDYLQNTMECCGINGYEDWAQYPYGNGTNVADGCCIDETVGCGVNMLINPNATELVFTRGCLSFVTGAFSAICLALSILTFALVLVQALSITWACIIAKDSRRYENI
ncbi:23 kDa integral membrane protein-like [Eriocheir sinensis]|uniref:23 kDa integral membrane protein-like n=1 Tax=Eriocheir sinensis TaxID=95602 RepID=UPI0021C83F8E|nr:23 kDa integral membrane protein-like [Eriocheir sinensis]